jgi:hypothetical protein
VTSPDGSANGGSEAVRAEGGEVDLLHD